MKSYSELSKIQDYLERYRYLRIGGNVGKETFGFERYLNQKFYKSPEWKKIRNQVILRDDGCDMGMPGHTINGRIYIHHINPVFPEYIVQRNDLLMNMENLICVSFDTHNAIHYGDESMLFEAQPVIRRPNDTIPWRN